MAQKWVVGRVQVRLRYDEPGIEREVLTQVADELSNREIASVLVVSEATVKSHLGRILSKLGLPGRAQAVVFAYQAGLVHPGSPGRPAP